MSAYVIELPVKNYGITSKPIIFFRVHDNWPSWTHFQVQSSLWKERSSLYCLHTESIFSSFSTLFKYPYNPSGNFYFIFTFLDKCSVLIYNSIHSKFEQRVGLLEFSVIMRKKEAIIRPSLQWLCYFRSGKILRDRLRSYVDECSDNSFVSY